MAQFRLGDVIDDHCIKCRRITNHAIVSLLNGEAAKVRCRTCYHDHDYRHEQAPPSKKELKRMAAAAPDGNAPLRTVKPRPRANSALPVDEAAPFAASRQRC